MRQIANTRSNTHKSPTTYKCRLAQKQEYRHDSFIVVGLFSICSKHMQYKVQCSHALLAARPLAVCAPPALPPATINRLGSGDFLADMSLYGSIAVTEGLWLLLLVHFLTQPAQRRQQCQSTLPVTNLFFLTSMSRPAVPRICPHSKATLLGQDLGYALKHCP